MNSSYAVQDYPDTFEMSGKSQNGSKTVIFISVHLTDLTGEETIGGG